MGHSPSISIGIIPFNLLFCNQIHTTHNFFPIGTMSFCTYIPSKHYFDKDVYCSDISSEPQGYIFYPYTTHTPSSHLTIILCITFT